MRKCQYEEKIDRYLAGQLSEMESSQFEDHYFNCPTCFQKTYEKNELMTFIQRDGATIFAPAAEPRPAETKVRLWDKIAAWFTPRQWVAAAVTAALLMVVVLGVVPLFRNSAPQFTLTGDQTVRGESLALIAPSGDLVAAPAAFSWKPVRGAVEYTVTLTSGPETLWTATTPDTNLALPDSVKSKLAAGAVYAWQVKAYAGQGTLLSASPLTSFKIAD